MPVIHPRPEVFGGIVEADNASVIKAYEGNFAKLEREKLPLTEKRLESYRRRAGWRSLSNRRLSF